VLLLLVLLLFNMLASHSSWRSHGAVAIGLLAVCSWTSSRGSPTVAVVADTASAVADAARTRLTYVIVASTVIAADIGATVASAVSNSTTGGSVRLRQLLGDTR
jgi:hypothetical protein